MLFGLACFTFSMWNFTPITHDWGWRELLIPQAFRGFSQQFAVAPTVTLTLGAIPPERLKLASGLFNLMRNLGGAIGIAVCGTILNDRTNLHFLRLAEHLNNTNSAMVELLGRAGAKAAALERGRCGHGSCNRPPAIMEPDNARGADGDLFGCIPGANAVPRAGDRDGAVDAESCASQSAGRRRALALVAAEEPFRSLSRISGLC